VTSNAQPTVQTQPSYPGDFDGDIVANWLRKDPTRWVAGILAGALAGLVAMAVAMILSSSVGMESWFPVKLLSTPILGAVGTDNMIMTGAVVGFLVWELIGIFWGFVYSHFVGTNSFRSLLAMGLVWGIFLWIFNWNLYFQSFKPIRWSAVPSAAAFLICVTYGLSLSSVAFFDRLFRRS
jgi:hypothetical protein